MRLRRHFSSGSEKQAERRRKVREMIHDQGLSSLTLRVLCNGEAGLMGLRLALWWKSAGFISIAKPKRLRISGNKGPSPPNGASEPVWAPGGTEDDNLWSLDRPLNSLETMNVKPHLLEVRARTLVWGAGMGFQALSNWLFSSRGPIPKCHKPVRTQGRHVDLLSLMYLM